nr:hypothetical protein [Ktedonobacterales bacterium]
MSEESTMGARDADSPRWQTCYEAARRLLDDATTLAALARAVARLHPTAPPTAEIIAGAATLREARRVGMLPGSFNPLTAAHVALAEAARSAAGLDHLVWLCAARTVDKERVERAALPDRLAQLVAYARTQPGNAVALTNHGLYVDEARALREHLTAQAALFILVGFDKLPQMLDPRYYTDREAALTRLFALARVLVAPRAGAGQAELVALLARPENQRYADMVGYVPLPVASAEESSTEARRLAAERGGQAADAALRAL